MSQYHPPLKGGALYSVIQEVEQLQGYAASIQHDFENGIVWSMARLPAWAGSFSERQTKFFNQVCRLCAGWIGVSVEAIEIALVGNAEIDSPGGCYYGKREVFQRLILDKLGQVESLLLSEDDLRQKLDEIYREREKVIEDDGKKFLWAAPLKKPLAFAPGKFEAMRGGHSKPQRDRFAPAWVETPSGPRRYATPENAPVQAAKRRWRILRIDDVELLRARPDLARHVQWNKAAIMAILNAGGTLPGVTAEECLPGQPAPQVAPPVAERTPEAKTLPPGTAPAEWCAKEMELAAKTEKPEVWQSLLQAVELIRKEKRASVQMLQNRLGFSYNKSLRIIAKLEKFGVIGPSDGVNPRKILKIPNN